MLTALRIRNLALVDELTIGFDPGYTAVTGETGAGKSIIIGALELALGERADRTLIRSGAEHCTVEAVFDVRNLQPPVAPFLDEHGLDPCEDHQLILKRTLTAAGTNRQFVNGSPTSLQTLARLGNTLVDIHGPHDHQSLFHPSRQLDLLDAHASLEPDRLRFATLLQEYRVLLEQKSALIVDEAAYARQLDLLRHQVHEIESARLQPDEEESVQAEHQRARNAHRLLELAQHALTVLADDDASLLQLSGQIGRALQDLERLDPTANPIQSLHTQAVSQLQELQSTLRHYADRIEVDPAQLQKLEDRLNLLQGLKRKYGPTLASVLAFADRARNDLALLESREARLAEILSGQQRLQSSLAQLGATLTRQRRQAIPRLCRAVAAELQHLGFRQCRFEIDLRTSTPDPTTPNATPLPAGYDTIEFLFAPNPGEPPRPLRQIASSGEMARVMLALKTVLAAHDHVPVLVFDEVDANVGGETAQAVGNRMRQLGDRHQVLCITHLAPVAAAAASHFVVTKETADGRTVTRMQPVRAGERIEELARMLGQRSDTARRHARELLGQHQP